MKIINSNFRDYDRKYVLCRDKDIIKKIDIKLSVPFIGYLYIDHIKGISLRIVGDENNTLIEGIPYIFRYEDIKDIDFEIVNNKILEFDKLMDNYYKDKEIIDVREILEIDKFRLNSNNVSAEEMMYTLNSNPDIIEIEIEDNSKKEKLWGRVIGYKSDEGIVCLLINDSNVFDNLYKGNSVLVRYDNKLDKLIVIGKIDL